VLVGPQLGENIGTAARAMLNCGLADLRLVEPRDGWPNAKAVAAASGADRVIDDARVFAGIPEAIADCHRVYAATARPRDGNAPAGPDWVAVYVPQNATSSPSVTRRPISSRAGSRARHVG